MLNYIFKTLNVYTFIGGVVTGIVVVVMLQAIVNFILGHWREILIICAVIVACCAILVVLGG